MGKILTDVTFALRVLMEKYRAGQKEPRCVFVDVEKVDDRMLRQEVHEEVSSGKEVYEGDSGEVCSGVTDGL